MKHKDALPENPHWKAANAIAGHIYGKFDAFADMPEEKWNTEHKLRNAAADLVLFTAQAVSNALPETASYDWNNVLKTLFALRAVYTFAHKQKFITIDPDIVVQIDALLAVAQTNVAAAQREAERKTKDELEPWLQKYRIWKEMEGGI